MSKYKFLVGVTGSIACYKTCTLISQLVKSGHEVQVVATRSAFNFVGAATLEGLSGRPVACEQFVSGQMMDHIALARWADIFVVAPLTASHLGHFANGIADDLLSTLFLAFEPTKPFYIAPAMNTKMLEHPATQENLKRLTAWGTHVISPNSGRLACGEEGAGKMAEPEEIFKIVTAELNLSKNQILSDEKSELPIAFDKNLQNLSHARTILVTYGGTQEPIDGVRSITNFSTGRTGSELIDLLSAQGHRVTALAGVTAVKAESANNLIRFTSHSDLQNKIKTELQNYNYDTVIHLAAISDYTVERVVTSQGEHPPTEDQKLSSNESLTLKLKKTSKIVTSLKELSKNKNITVIGFKLTKTLDPEFRKSAALQLLNSADIDYVVQNDLNEIHAEKNIHPFTLYKHNAEPFRLQSVHELAVAIDTILEKHIEREVQNDLMS